MQGDRLDKALEFTASMMSTRDIDDLLGKILDIITEDFGFEGCDAFLLDRDKKGYVLKATRGYPEAVRQKVDRLFKTEESVSADLARCVSLGRFTRLYRAVPGDDPESYYGLLHRERASLPRETPDSWHELDILYLVLEDQAGRNVGFLQPDGPRDGMIPSGSTVMNLEIFAALASIAVANAEMVHELNKNVRSYKTLAKTTARLQEPVDLKDTLKVVAEGLKELVPFQEISVYLLDWDRNLMVPVYATGPYADLVMADIGPISGLAGDVAKCGKVEIIADSEADDRVDEIPGMEDIGESQTIMCIPLKSKAGEVDGVLALYRQKANQYTEAEWEIAEPFAAHAAIAVENARLREELRQNFESAHKAFEEMKELDRAKDSLVNTISHELRTPLTTILGYLEMASEGMYGDTSPKLRDKMQAMVASVNRMNVLVEKMLEMTRLQDGSLSLELEPVNLAMLAREVVKELDAEVARKQHTLSVLFGTELPIVEADRMRMHDVLFNMVHNAVRFTEDGGKITIGADILGGRVHIWVKDSGRGITEDDKKRVFDRFFLAGEGLAREDGRVGIGLYVSREIVRKHGGEMWFESRDGSGSTFHLALPLRQK